MKAGRQISRGDVTSDGGPLLNRFRSLSCRKWANTSLRVTLVLAFWTGVGLLFSTQMYLLTPGGTWSAAMRAAMPRWYIWGVLAPFIFAVDRRLFRRRRLLSRLGLHALFGVGFTCVAVTLRYAAETFIAEQGPGPATVFFVTNSYWDILIYGLIVGMHISRDLAGEAQRRELREAQLEARLAEARFRALQAQLQPHFLFNALNTISAYTETDPRLARRMMARLGELLRRTLDHAGQREVALHEELCFLDDYLAVERLRFEDRLTVDVAVEDDARQALVPSFLLQPLVENAIRHGINVQMRGGRILITARREGQRLALCIEDDGAGLPAGWRLEDHGGVGFRNTAQRLEELYGREHDFRITGAPGEGVRVDIVLPYKTAAEKERRVDQASKVAAR